MIICGIVCIFEKKIVLLHAELFWAAKVVKKYELTKHFASNSAINHQLLTINCHYGRLSSAKCNK